MVPTTDGPQTGDESDEEAVEETARKVDRFTRSIRSKVDLLTPENVHLLELGIKLSFTLVLTTLLVYWGIAYYFDLVLFEF